MVGRVIGLAVLLILAYYFIAGVAVTEFGFPVSPLWIVFGLIAALAVYSVWNWRRRIAKFTEVASLLGLEQVEGKLKPDDQEFADLDLFSKGHYRSMTNVLRGVNEWFFDYAFQTHSGKGTRTYTVALFKLMRGELPQFDLHPQGVLSRIAVAFGWQDIHFEDDPEFSRVFRLTGRDEDEVRELLDMLLRSELKAHPKWSFSGEAGWLAVYYRRTLPANRIFDFFNTARALARSFEKSARRLRRRP